MICSKCHLREHNGHSVFDIDDEKEEYIKAIDEVKEVVNKGEMELTDVKEKMVEKLTTSLSDIEKQREYLKDTVDKVMNNYTRQCIEHHDDNMRTMESNKALLEEKMNKLETMKEDPSNIRDGRRFRMGPLQDIIHSVDICSMTNGLMCLSYTNLSDTKEQWLIDQLCGQVTQSEWSQGQQAANQGHSQPQGMNFLISHARFFGNTCMCPRSITTSKILAHCITLSNSFA